MASAIIPHRLGRDPCAVLHPVNPVSKSSCRVLRLHGCGLGEDFGPVETSCSGVPLVSVSYAYFRPVSASFALRNKKSCGCASKSGKYAAQTGSIGPIRAKDVPSEGSLSLRPVRAGQTQSNPVKPPQKKPGDHDDSPVPRRSWREP